MGRILTAIGTATVAIALWVGAACAEEPAGSKPQAVVERQFDAFARDDAEAAYALADPAIKNLFADPSQFLDMVRTYYPAVYRHRSVEFGASAEYGDTASLKATLVDSDDVAWTALYKLRRDANGDWLIAGCVLVKLDATAI
jgi:hypothetical protein